MKRYILMSAFYNGPVGRVQTLKEWQAYLNEACDSCGWPRPELRIQGNLVVDASDGNVILKEVALDNVPPETRIKTALRIARESWRVERIPGVSFLPWHVLARGERIPPWCRWTGLPRDEARRTVRERRIDLAASLLGIDVDPFLSQEPGRWERLIRNAASAAGKDKAQ